MSSPNLVSPEARKPVVAPDPERVHRRLEAARRNLLDLSLRNRLLNYRPSRASGVEAVKEDPAQVYRLLVLEGRAMGFLPRQDPPLSTSLALVTLEQSPPPFPQIVEPTDRQDAFLATAEDTPELQRRLLKTWRDAQSSLEEQGVNVLFLALGMLHWSDPAFSGSPDQSSGSRPRPQAETHRAPLVLVPMLMERSSGNRFRLRYEGSEVGENLSLGAKLRELEIQPPPFPEDEESLDLEAYFQAVAAAVSTQPGWRVEREAVVLGFFSYNKYQMFRDLDGSLWPEENKPWQHRILGRLLDTGFPEGELPFPEEGDLDSLLPKEGLYEVVDADGSQTMAILQAKSGSSMIIEGPPGTGKSQTITNLIAQAAGEGKKVLFVAEKRAALEVVQRNLERVGLGDLCLELHSNKAGKRSFYARLEHTVQLGKPQLPPSLEEEQSQLAEAREILNEYCRAVHQPLPGRELSPYEAIGALLSLGEGGESLPGAPFAAMKDWREADFRRRLALVEKLQALLEEIGPPPLNPFWGSRLTLLLPEDRAALSALLGQLVRDLSTLETEASSWAMGLPTPLSLHQVDALAHALAKLASRPPLPSASLAQTDWLAEEPRLQGAIQAGERLAALSAKLALFRAEAWSTPFLGQDRDNLAALGDKLTRFLSPSYRAAQRRLQSLLAVPLPKEAAEQLSLADTLLEGQALRRTIMEAAPTARRCFGPLWQGERSDWAALRRALIWAVDLTRQRQANQLPPAILELLEQNTLPGAVNLPQEVYPPRDWAIGAQALATGVMEARSSLQRVLAQLKGEGLLTDFPTLPFDALRAWLGRCLERPEDLEEVVRLNLLAEEAASLGIAALCEQAVLWLQAQANANASLSEAFRRLWYGSVLREAVQLRPALARFQRTSHEATQAEFRRLDRLLLEANRARVALRHWEGVPRHTAGGSLGALQREFAKKSRHKAIRRIMGEAGEAIQAIQPVFLMSPLSVALFLPPDGPHFDLVIFDEASQVRPEDAFGPILRADQAIVVGDSRQMPPTSFFEKLTQSEEEAEGEEDITSDLESILGLMGAQIAPASLQRRDLRWHYRSLHDALIATSNRLFYGERLLVFPSADQGSGENGLFFHHLEGTAYGRGGNQRNQEEARQVALTALEHARSRPQRTMGIAAFSLAQQEAIFEELEKLRSGDPSLDQLDRLHPNEPLFVKNLENVQGDERDVILLSVGYGRDASGKVSMNFGPLNQAGGERRLNVLISRARARCEVFSNLRSADLRQAEGQPPGIQALRTFLHFAETGEMDLPVAAKPPPSPFQLSLQAELEGLGVPVHSQLGTAGFYLDLAVDDAKTPGNYLLGVECDGLQYAGADNARDRDRLRQEVLERRGWRLYHAWSEDWWRNRDSERERLRQAVSGATSSQPAAARQPLAGCPVDSPPSSPSDPSNPSSSESPRPSSANPPLSSDVLPTVNSAPPPGEEVLPRRQEEAPSTVPAVLPYQLVQLKIQLGEGELREVSLPRLAEWVAEVVRVEGPVHEEEVLRRIREGAGLARLGKASREALLRGAELAASQGRLFRRSAFLWPPPPFILLMRDRSALPAASRKPEYLPDEEIEAALRYGAEVSFGLSREEAATAALKQLGFERPNEVALARVQTLIDSLLIAGLLQERNGLLKP
ncbi:MAG: DUF3320 domain-containing protein, partial [Coprothermobacterota bacterium]|nr:DUF3320 domain-containing protein [Coprothermobacterota bacterium]